MTRTRLAWLVLVLAALALSLAYGLKDKGAPQPSAADLGPLRTAAALDPCPRGISSELPDVALPCLGGGPDVPLRGVPTGVPTLVNVYGSWCAPCQEEMPVLVEFAGLAKGKVALVGVDTLDEPRLALQFAKDLGQTWPAVVDDDKQVLVAYAAGPPVTLFVDAAGKVVHVERGPFRRLADLQHAVQQHLGVST